jgi:hypothetical protein
MTPRPSSTKTSEDEDQLEVARNINNNCSAANIRLLPKRRYPSLNQEDTFLENGEFLFRLRSQSFAQMIFDDGSTTPTSLSSTRKRCGSESWFVENDSTQGHEPSSNGNYSDSNHTQLLVETTPADNMIPTKPLNLSSLDRDTRSDLGDSKKVLFVECPPLIMSSLVFPDF